MQPHDLAAPDAPWASALLLHPHPDMGGDRFNNVVTALFEALPPAGVTALRFDFSTSRVDLAAREAVEMLDLLSPAPRFLVGYSFGAGIASKIDDARVAGRCLIAPPVSMLEQPGYVIAAEHDQFFPPSDLDPDAIVASADHFFAGRTDEVVRLTLEWITRVGR
jgi:alpha/beta superfamily hydrolase